MRCVDRYGLPLTGGADAVAAYNRGVGNLLRLEEGSLHAVAASVAADPTFALGHAAMALLGHELCAPVHIEARIRAASTRRLSSPACRSTPSPVPGTPRTRGPTPTTRPATTPRGWPGWTAGSPGRAPRSTACATSPGTPRCTSCRRATWTPCAAATRPSCGRSLGWAAG